MRRFLVCAILAAGLTTGAAAQSVIVYDNTTTNLYTWSPWDWPGHYSFPYEHGDHLNLDGTERSITQIDILFTNPLSNSVTADVTVRLYEGDPLNGENLLWTDTQAAHYFPNNQPHTYTAMVPNVELPADDCTVTYEFSNIVGDPVGVGLQSFYPPTVGSSEGWFPAKVEGAWNHYTYGDPNKANFAMRVYAEAASYERGDVNCDGAIDGFDIDPFVLLLSIAEPYDEYYALYPDCDHMLGDINDDGAIDGFDIDPFVDLLGG